MEKTLRRSRAQLPAPPFALFDFSPQVRPSALTAFLLLATTPVTI